MTLRDTSAPAKQAPGISTLVLALVAGGICAAWAFIAWLTVIPNQDMLADAIQVQSVIAHPHLVLAFPGQKHAGPIEYPVQILAELIAPGNFYVHTVARIALAFLTGFVAARLFRTIVPTAPAWSFIGAVLVGPAVIHGLAGPEGNRVAVQWLVGNYDMSWLLVTTGAWLLARALSRRNDTSGDTSGGTSWVYLGSGLLVGLGFFAHPNVTLLIIPLAVLVLVRFRWRARDIAVTVVGAVVGVIPAVVSYVVNAHITTWDPSHPLFVSIPLYLNSLGLDGIPDYITAVLPSAIGFPSSQTLLSATVQSVGTAIFVALVTVCAVVGVVNAIRHRTRPSTGTAIALAWVGVFGAIILFTALVAPVWFYASSLSILLWITIGVLPVLLTRHHVGAVVAALWICLLAVATISHNAAFYADFPQRIAAKQQYLADIHSVADTLQEQGADYIFGSYFDAIPIAYASNAKLRAITTHYDRFPITADELQQTHVTVAVRMDAGTDGWMLEAIDRVEQQCTPVIGAAASQSLSTPLGQFGIFDCPPSALRITREGA